ncbi:hypothetical protein KZZ52_49930 [Dactylosporangium sp. AC04546]|uniref:hypothetical protein n=1 Tax=Dactylosporangium sp. AC04546 TaxID=2862460 RepID=UPI001EDEE203|nr:hypothetical protein [Dactylosporangium sp. AC04546]WVK82005.1 hypothetical protein KZZ52_49930 [Dactylosporangium sp. AC04546]
MPRSLQGPEPHPPEKQSERDDNRPVVVIILAVLAVTVTLAAMRQPLTDYAAVITATAGLIYAVARLNRRNRR